MFPTYVIILRPRAWYPMPDERSLWPPQCNPGNAPLVVASTTTRGLNMTECQSINWTWCRELQDQSSGVLIRLYFLPCYQWKLINYLQIQLHWTKPIKTLPFHHFLLLSLFLRSSPTSYPWQAFDHWQKEVMGTIDIMGTCKIPAWGQYCSPMTFFVVDKG